MKPESAELMKTINTFYKDKGGATRDVLASGSSLKVKFISTGSRSLDRVLGGGLAIGRSAEFIGELSTLKSYFAYQTMANAQQIGMNAALLDTEGSYEERRAQQLGVDTDALLLIDRNLRGDEALDVVESLILSGNFAVVIDSVAALLPKEDAESRMGEATVARQAALMSKAMRKLTNSNRDSLLLFINQLRENIGITFGARTRAPGGKALGFYATHRVKFVKIETIREARPRYEAGKIENKSVPVEQLIQATVEKSKVGQPYQEAIFRFSLESGMVNSQEELLNLGLELGIIRKEGQSFIFPDSNGEVVKAVHRKNALKQIEKHEDHLGILVDAQLSQR